MELHCKKKRKILRNVRSCSKIAENLQEKCFFHTKKYLAEKFRETKGIISHCHSVWKRRKPLVVIATAPNFEMKLIELYVIALTSSFSLFRLRRSIRRQEINLTLQSRSVNFIWFITESGLWVDIHWTCIDLLQVVTCLVMITKSLPNVLFIV